MIWVFDDLLLKRVYCDVVEIREDFYYDLGVKYPGGGVKSFG